MFILIFKFSTDPERFIIVEDSCQEEGKERIQISAKFPWKTEIIETIGNHGNNHLSIYGSTFEVIVYVLYNSSCKK